MRCLSIAGVATWLVASVSGQDLFLPAIDALPLKREGSAAPPPPAAGIDAHVLDVSLGHGAGGVVIDCHYQVGGAESTEWKFIGKQVTQPSGRTDLFTSKLEAGVYRITYNVGDYFAKSNR